MFDKVKKYGIFMVPTTTGVLIMKDGKLDTCYNHDFSLYNPRHEHVATLVVVSDDMIALGDYIYCNNAGSKTISKCATQEEVDNLSIDCRKIVTSSDFVLTPKHWINRDFVKLYVSRYNAKSKIIEVELELEECGHVVSMGKTGLNHHHSFQIKTDGYVVRISPVEISQSVVSMEEQKTYSKKEVLLLLNDFGKHVSKEILGQELEMIGELEKWTPGKL